MLKQAMRMGVGAAEDTEPVRRIRAELEAEQRLIERFKVWLEAQPSWV